jgi:uncharacterized protein YecT (DUF1311 family)
MLKAFAIVVLLNSWLAGCGAQSSDRPVDTEIPQNVKEARAGLAKKGRQNDCSEGGANTVEINECLAVELEAAEAKMRQYFAEARARFIDSVNEEYREDDAASKKAAIAEFDAAQKSWLAAREQHCSSVYYYWQSGTIRGAMHARCLIQLTEIRTRLIWQEWLTYMDSTPPLLPEPPTGFESSKKSAG